LAALVLLVLGFLGGAAIDMATPGVQLNFISKRGGDQFRGGAYFGLAPFGLSKSPSAEMTTSGWVYPKTNSLWDLEGHLGGPILKDRIWFFSSLAARGESRRSEADLDHANSTWSGVAKFDYEFGLPKGDLSGSVTLLLDRNRQNGVSYLAPGQQDADSLWQRRRPGFALSGTALYEFNNLTGQLRLNTSRAKDELVPGGAEINSATNHSEGNEWLTFLPQGNMTGSAIDYSGQRQSSDFALDGNYFLEGVLGGDHEIRFGVDYFTANTTTQSLFPNQRASYIDVDDPTRSYIRLDPDSIFDTGFRRTAFYLQDTVTFGKLTASLGIRFDKESAHVNSVRLPAFTWYEPGSPHHGAPLFPNAFPELTIKDFDLPSGWSLLSPRLGVTYDFAGDGRTVLRGSFGRYLADGTRKSSFNYFPARSGYVRWNDANGDKLPQFAEIGSDLFAVPYQYGQECPTTGLAPSGYDKDYSAPRLDELTVGLERELLADLSASLTAYYKRKSNLAFDIGSDGRLQPVRTGILADGSLETKANWKQTGTIEVGGEPVMVYERLQLPVGWYYHNLEQAYDRYLGLQLMLNKRLAKGWQGYFAFTWQDWKRYRFEDETLDMNNFYFFNKGVVAPVANGLGSSHFVNSNWQLQAAGLYQLPWGLNLTGFFSARQGNPAPLRRQALLNQGPVYFYRQADNRLGDERLPAFWMLNLGLEKTLKISETVDATVCLDWYNATNNQIALQYADVAATGSEPSPILWSNAGLFQFGVRVNF
jgi:hypothetical protein